MHDVGRILTETAEEAAFDMEAFDSTESFEGMEQEAGPFPEIEEMELAAELLEVGSEEELDQFLGKLIKKAGAALGKFAKSPAGKQLFGILRGAAKAALPKLGALAGGFVGGPAGAAIGGKLAAGAGQMFGLELEGLSPEDQEYEVARRVVRFAGATVQNAAAAPTEESPAAAAVVAARRHAPGLLTGRTGVVTGGGNCGCGSGRAASGRWMRRGQKIVLLGA